MKKVYGIFYFENYDEKAIHSVHLTRKLAEKELRTLDFLGTLPSSGKIEEITLYEDEKELDKMPYEVEVQGRFEEINSDVEIDADGNIRDSRTYENIAVKSEVYLYDREIPKPETLFDVNFLLYSLKDMKNKRFGFSILMLGSCIDDPDLESNVKMRVRHRFHEFWEQFRKLFHFTKMRFRLKIADCATENKLSIQDSVVLDLLDADSSQLSRIENSAENVKFAYKHLCDNFVRSIKLGFPDVFERYVGYKIDENLLKKIEEQFISSAHGLYWFNKRDPLDLTLCFRVFAEEKDIFAYDR